MSWNAYITDDRGHSDGEWSYTSNTSCMANAVLDDHPVWRAMLVERSAMWWERRDRPDVAKQYRDGDYGTWWSALDAMPGPEGGALLHFIIQGLEADPERFRQLNPTNGWGDYDSFLQTLTAMRDAVPEWPTTWEVNG